MILEYVVVGASIIEAQVLSGTGLGASLNDESTTLLANRQNLGFLARYSGN
jgi:hypothetical protein